MWKWTLLGVKALIYVLTSLGIGSSSEIFLT
jgi:hypothetical protein